MDQLSALSIIFTVLTLAVSIISWYSLRYKNSIKEGPPLPPGPWGLPILGYLPFLQINLHKQFTQLAEKYGPIYKLWIGSKLCMVISSPALIKEIVRDQDTIFANRDPPIAALVITSGEDIVWANHGSYWRDMRKLFARELLSINHLEASCSLIKDEIKRLVESLHGKIGSLVEIGELIFVTELKVVMSLLWGGVTMNEENSNRVGVDFRVAVSKLVDLIGKPNLSDFFPVLAKFDFQGIEKETRSLVPIVEEILDSVISERMKMMVSGKAKWDDERKDFLQILLELEEQNDPERSINLTQIKALLMDIVAGGTDTTATITEWVMTEILNNPQVMKSVRQELIDVVGMGNTLEVSHISKLHYLDAVVRESLRLHPPVPLLVPRSPSKSCIIGGYTIPKGTRVFLNAWSIHMDPLVWEKPHEFKPERFLSEPGKFDYRGNNFQYIPFGSGRRVCPGIPLAERMTMFFLATLFHSFDWKLAEAEKLDRSETFGIVMRKSIPLFAIPSQRLSDLNIYD